MHILFWNENKKGICVVYLSCAVHTHAVATVAAASQNCSMPESFFFSRISVSQQTPFDSHCRGEADNEQRRTNVYSITLEIIDFADDSTIEIVLEIVQQHSENNPSVSGWMRMRINKMFAVSFLGYQLFGSSFHPVQIYRTLNWATHYYVVLAFVWMCNRELHMT